VFAEITDQFTCRIGLDIQQTLYLLDADHRILIEVPDKSLGVLLPADMETRKYFAFDAFLERNYLFENLDGLAGRLPHAVQKEPEPIQQVMVGAHCGQMIVIIALMLLKEKREIQGRFGKQPEADQVENNEQSPKTAIAVQKGMDGFKLIMNDADLDQVGNMDFFIMHEFFQVAHQFRNMFVMGRNKGGIFQTHADPVLAGAEFSRLFMLAAHTLQEDAMGILDQAAGKRQSLQLADGSV